MTQLYLHQGVPQLHPAAHPGHELPWCSTAQAFARHIENTNGWQHIFSTFRNTFWIKREINQHKLALDMNKKNQSFLRINYEQKQNTTVYLFHIQKGYCYFSFWATECGLNLQKKPHCEVQQGIVFALLFHCFIPSMGSTWHIKAQIHQDTETSSWSPGLLGWIHRVLSDHTKKKFTELWSS